MDEFVKDLHTELQKGLRIEAPKDGTRHRNRKGRLSESGIMTIPVCYHFGSSGNFKHYYMLYVRGRLGSYFLDAVSYDMSARAYAACVLPHDAVHEAPSVR